MKRHENWGWFFVTPFVLALLCFNLIPMLFSLYISFTDYDLYNAPIWSGMKNFLNCWNDSKTWSAFRNIFTYSIIMQAIQIFFGCVLANLLNQKLKGTSFFRLLYFLPVLTPVVASTFVWENLYNPVYGLFNHILSLVGIEPLQYCYSRNWFESVASVGVMQGWKGIGYTTVYLLAALQGISDDVVEASNLDGAGGFTRFFKITLPLISPTIFFLIMTGLITSMQVFEPFFLMQQDTGANTEVIGQLIYSNAFEYNNAGYASAIGWTTFAIVSVMTYLQKQLEKRWVFYG